MARMTDEEIAAGYRAAERARAVLKDGDRIRVTRCGGGAPTFTFRGFDGLTKACIEDGKPPFWMWSASGLNDLAPTSIIAVNGVPTSFRDDPEAHLANPFDIPEGA